MVSARGLCVSLLVSLIAPCVSLRHVVKISATGLTDVTQWSAGIYVHSAHNFRQEEPLVTKAFFRELDEAAKILKWYNVSMFLFDCDEEKSEVSFCKANQPNPSITAKIGNIYHQFDLDATDSTSYILANMLCLLHQAESPTICTLAERSAIEQSEVAKRDILLVNAPSYCVAEASIILEVAFLFKDQFKIVLSTGKESTIGLQSHDKRQENNWNLWLLFCSETSQKEFTEGKVCHNVMFQGYHDLKSVSDFVNNVHEETTVSPDDKCEMSPYANTLLPDSHVIFVFYEERDTIQPIVDYITSVVRGSARLVPMDINHEECRKRYNSRAHKGHLPTLFISEKFADISKDNTIADIERFFEENLWHNEDTDDIDEEDVETQDDEIASEVFDRGVNNLNLTQVPGWSRATFQTTLSTKHASIVLFYLTFDPTGIVVLTSFIEAARILSANDPSSNILSRVECFDATDVCAAENITTYPVIKIYQKGHAQQVYCGPRDSASLVTAAKLLQLQSPVELKSRNSVEEFLLGNQPSSLSELPSSGVLLLASVTDDKAVQMFKQASSSLIAPFAYVLDELAKQVAKDYDVSLPAVIAKNKKDPPTSIRKLTSDLDTENIKYFARSSMSPKVPELTYKNFPFLHQKRKPITILFLDKDDLEMQKLMESFNTIASSVQFSNALFCWMDARAKTIGQQILSEYNENAVPPVISVLDKQTSQVHNSPNISNGLNDITEWLQNVLTGKQSPSKKLQSKKWGPPKETYDFLKKIDRIPGHPLNYKQNEDSTPDQDSHFDYIRRNLLLQQKMRLKILTDAISLRKQDTSNFNEKEKKIVHTEF